MRADVLKICVAMIVVLVVWQQFLVLDQFAVRYTDKDQVLMWTAAYELLQGRLHEPRFYGQDYNAMLEGWLAAPLVALDVPYHVAVPVATSVLALAPFLALGICAWRAGHRLSAAIALATPLLLPIEHSLMTSMPRGLVTGNVFLAVAACLVLFPMTRASVFVSGLALALAAALNPTVMILAVPLVLFIVVRHRHLRHGYWWFGAGILLGIAAHGASILFYRFNPEHLVYPVTLRAAFSLDALLWGWRHLSNHLGVVVPLWPGQVWLLGVLFLATAIGLWRCQARLPLLAFVLAIALTGLSFGIGRVYMGSTSVYWHWARFYLSLPLVMTLGFVWLEQAAGDRIGAARKNLASILLSVVVVMVFVRHTWIYDEAVERNINAVNNVGIEGVPVERIHERCAELEKLARETGHSLVVFGYIHKIVAYACEPVLHGRIRTLVVRDLVAERRTWRLQEELASPTREVLFYNFSPEQIDRGRSLGLVTDPAVSVGNVRVVPGRLPDGVSLFEVLGRMDVPGGAELEARARRLQARAASR